MKQTLQNTLMLIAAMAAGYLGGMMSQGSPMARAAEVKPVVKVQDEIRAKKIVLVDDKGKIRGMFSMIDKEPSLVLVDSEGKPRGMFSMIDKEPSLVLVDSEGKLRGTFCLLKGGIPAIELQDSNEITRGLFSQSGINIFNEEEENIWSTDTEEPIQDEEQQGNDPELITLPAGEFKVGEDINPGRYEVTSTGFFIVSHYDERIKMDNVMKFKATFMKDFPGSVDNYICNLEEDDTIKISAPTTFKPYKK